MYTRQPGRFSQASAASPSPSPSPAAAAPGASRPSRPSQHWRSRSLWRTWRQAAYHIYIYIYCIIIHDR